MAIGALVLAGCAGTAEARDGAAPSAGTPAVAWDRFREGERRARDGDLKGALDAYTGARAALAAGLPLDRSLADALALDLYNLAASLSSAADTASSLKCFEQLFLLRRRTGSLRDDAFERALEDGSDTLADYAVSAGRPESAIPVYTARLEIDPSNARTRLKLAGALLALGKFDAARREALEVRRIDRLSADSWTLTARIDLAESSRLMDAGTQRESRLRVEWATDDLEEALKLDRDNPTRQREYATAAGNLGDLLDEEGDYAGGDAARLKSLGAIDEALRSAPSDGDLRLDRGRLLMKADRYPEAAEDLERAIGALERKGPSESLRAAREALAGGLLVVASDALNEGRFADASSALSRARPLDPGRRARIDALAASVEVARGRFDESAKAGETGPAGRTESPTILLALSDLYAMYARYDEARSALTRAANAEAGRPSEVEIALRSFRMRPGIAEPAKKAEIEVEGGRISLLGPSEDVIAEMRKPLVEVWRRTIRVLGLLPSGETPLIKVYGNQRAFRSGGIPRLGWLTTETWHRGCLYLFMDPGRDAVAWGKVLARGIGAWATDRLSRGRAPLWMKRGISHWLAEDAGAGDTELLRQAVADGRWAGIGELDPELQQSWNDGSRMAILDAESRLLVSTLAATRGNGAPRATLVELATAGGSGMSRALVSAAKLDTASLEKLALGSLRVTASVPAP
jgi:tetratricopeptide (TPR) repeat protein